MARIEVIYRRALLLLIAAVIGPVFVLGVLMLDPLVQMGFEPTVAFIGVAIYLAVIIVRDAHPRLLDATLAGVATAALIPTVYGFVVFLGAVSIVLLVGLGLLALPLVVMRGAGGAVPVRPAAGLLPGTRALLQVPLHEITVLLSAVPTPHLCAAWRRATEETAALHPAERLRLAELRGLVLDELERRDPVGFAEWLRASRVRWHGPEAFLRHA